MIDQEEVTTIKQGVKFNIAAPDLIPVPENRGVELFAKIKRTSKYYYQGLDQNGKPRAFKIDAIQYGSHSFRMNSNNYRSQDLTFWVKGVEDNLIPLAGGKRR